MGRSGISGMKLGPEPYPIPLQVTIAKVEPEVIGPRDEFLLEIELKNTGPAPFFFPISQDIGRVQGDENRGRRTALLFIHFENPAQSKLDLDAVGLLGGSSSIAESLKRLNPGDSILVRLKGDLDEVSKLMSPDQGQVTFRAGYRERTLKDGEFAVENVSEKVTSNGTFTLGLKRE